MSCRPQTIEALHLMRSNKLNSSIQERLLLSHQANALEDIVLNLDQGFLQSFHTNCYIHLYQYNGSLTDEQIVTECNTLHEKLHDIQLKQANA
jgi:hypothetical protein